MGIWLGLGLGLEARVSLGFALTGVGLATDMVRVRVCYG